MYKGEIPPRVNIRLRGIGSRSRRQQRFQLLVRNGKGWDPIGEPQSENKAMERIGHHFANLDAKWTLGVKVRAGWCCEVPGCGEGVGGDKKLLEAHHIKPKEQFPELRCDSDNGKCLCLFHHAAQHTGWARLTILARLGLILLARLYPHKKAEIQRMAG